MAECVVAYNVSGSITDEETGGDDSGLWFVGLLLSVIGGVLSVIGLNLQRLSQKRNAARPAGAQKSPLAQPLNICGVVLLTGDAVFDFLSFGFAPQSVIAPMGALTLVLNMVVAPFIVKEKLTRNDVIATLLVFFGVMLAIIFADRRTPEYTFDILWCFLGQRAFQIYAVINLVWLLSLYGTLKWIEKGGEQRQVKYMHIRRAAYPALAGTLGGGSVLFAKAAIELIKGAILGDPAFKKFGTYVIIVLLAASLLTQVRFLNRGLQYFEALFVVPVYQAFWVLVGILGGSIYFSEFSHFSALQVLMYTIGILMSICGVLLLSQRGHGAEDRAEGDERARGPGVEIANVASRTLDRTLDMTITSMRESFAGTSRMSALTSRGSTSSDLSAASGDSGEDGRGVGSGGGDGDGDKDRATEDEEGKLRYMNASQAGSHHQLLGKGVVDRTSARSGRHRRGDGGDGDEVDAGDQPLGASLGDVDLEDMSSLSSSADSWGDAAEIASWSRPKPTEAPPAAPVSGDRSGGVADASSSDFSVWSTTVATGGPTRSGHLPRAESSSGGTWTGGRPAKGVSKSFSTVTLPPPGVAAVSADSSLFTTLGGMGGGSAASVAGISRASSNPQFPLDDAARAAGGFTFSTETSPSKANGGRDPDSLSSSF